MELILSLIHQVLDLWDVVTGQFSPEQLPAGAYLVCSALVLALWWYATSLFPALVRRLLWALAVAVLISPTVTGGGNPQLAPANVAALYGLAIDNTLLWQTSLLSMIFTFFVVLLLQSIWLQIKAQSAAKPPKLLPDTPDRA